MTTHTNRRLHYLKGYPATSHPTDADLPEILCDAGGAVGFPGKGEAIRHAIDRSNQPCRECGAD